MNKTSNTITALHLFFIMLQTQIGLGIFWTDKLLFKHAGNDSWLAIIFMGIITQVLVTIIWYCVKKFPNKSTPEIFNCLLGKTYGTITSLLYICYFIAVQILIMFMLAHILNVWILPETPAWAIILLATLTITYTGMQNLQSHSYFYGLTSGFLIIFVLFFLLALKQADARFLFPIMHTKIPQLFKGATAVFVVFIGFETLLFYMNYTKSTRPQKIYTAVTLANVAVTLFYAFLIMLVTICFSPNELQSTSQPIIAMIKGYQYGIIDRYDDIFLGFWMWIVIASMMNYAFLYNQTIKFLTKNRLSLESIACLTSTIVFIGSLNINTISRIATYQKYFGWFCLAAVVIIPITLLIISFFRVDEVVQ